MIIIKRTEATAEAAFGTFSKLFAQDSPWNCRPINPSFGTYQIPDDAFQPGIGGGTYSTAIFLGKAEHPPKTVYPLIASPGITDPDAEINTISSITIPHWPPELVPAAGSDGHADLYDETSGIIYTFWVLKFDTGEWRCSLLAWTPHDGRGWGNPGHYYQGSRAVGVISAAGLVRTFEVNDGKSVIQHALTMSLPHSALSDNTPGPTWIFPATTSDSGPEANFGSIPEGALVMLPESFSPEGAGITLPFLAKIINTLKTYGAYITDRNGSTPFFIYVENGAPDTGLYGHGNDGATYTELNRIKNALRTVDAATGWITGAGQQIAAHTRRLNLLSMRGLWTLDAGSSLGVFNTFTQAVEFTAVQTGITQRNTQGSALRPQHWYAPQVGQVFKITCYATGGASMVFRLYGTPFVERYSSGILTDGQTTTFAWPADPNNGGVPCTYCIPEVFSGNSGTAKSVGATVISET